jgi:hypothetical protein
MTAPAQATVVLCFLVATCEGLDLQAAGVAAVLVASVALRSRRTWDR